MKSTQPSDSLGHCVLKNSGYPTRTSPNLQRVKSLESFHGDDKAVTHADGTMVSRLAVDSDCSNSSIVDSHQKPMRKKQRTCCSPARSFLQFLRTPRNPCANIASNGKRSRGDKAMRNRCLIIQPGCLCFIVVMAISLLCHAMATIAPLVSVDSYTVTNSSASSNERSSGGSFFFTLPYLAFSTSSTAINIDTGAITYHSALTGCLWSTDTPPMSPIDALQQELYENGKQESSDMSMARIRQRQMLTSAIHYSEMSLYRTCIYFSEPLNYYSYAAQFIPSISQTQSDVNSSVPDSDHKKIYTYTCQCGEVPFGQEAFRQTTPPANSGINNSSSTTSVASNPPYGGCAPFKEYIIGLRRRYAESISLTGLTLLLYLVFFCIFASTREKVSVSRGRVWCERILRGALVTLSLIGVVLSCVGGARGIHLFSADFSDVQRYREDGCGYYSDASVDVAAYVPYVPYSVAAHPPPTAEGAEISSCPSRQGCPLLGLPALDYVRSSRVQRGQTVYRRPRVGFSVALLFGAALFALLGTLLLIAVPFP